MNAKTVATPIARCHGTDPNFVIASVPSCAGEARVFFVSSIIAATQLAVWALDDNCGIASAAVDFQVEFGDGLSQGHQMIRFRVAEAETFIARAIVASGDGGNGDDATCGATDGCSFLAPIEGNAVKIGCLSASAGGVEDTAGDG